MATVALAAFLYAERPTVLRICGWAEVYRPCFCVATAARRTTITLFAGTALHLTVKRGAHESRGWGGMCDSEQTFGKVNLLTKDICTGARRKSFQHDLRLGLVL